MAKRLKIVSKVWRKPLSLKPGPEFSCQMEILQMWHDMSQKTDFMIGAPNTKEMDAKNKLIYDEFERRKNKVIAKYRQIKAQAQPILSEIENLTAQLKELHGKLARLQKFCKHNKNKNGVCEDCGLKTKK